MQFLRATAYNFPAYSWVLAKRLLSGWLVGKSCLSRVSLSVRAEGRQARVCARPPCLNTAGEARQRRVSNTKEVSYTC